MGKRTNQKNGDATETLLVAIKNLDVAIQLQCHRVTGQRRGRRKKKVSNDASLRELFFKIMTDNEQNRYCWRHQGVFEAPNAQIPRITLTLS